MKILLLADIHSNWPCLPRSTRRTTRACFWATSSSTLPILFPASTGCSARATAAIRGNHDHAVGAAHSGQRGRRLSRAGRRHAARALAGAHSVPHQVPGPAAPHAEDRAGGQDAVPRSRHAARSARRVPGGRAGHLAAAAGDDQRRLRVRGAHAHAVPSRFGPFTGGESGQRGPAA